MKKIKNLALCGGGFYGFAEVGALMELENYGNYLDLENISGVSVGSIIAGLYAVGYTAQELSDIIFNFDFDYLIKDSMFPYINLYTKYGMYEAKRLEEQIEKLISQKTHIKNCTFAQIKMNLTIVATNLNYQCASFFNKEQTPDMVISRAIRMSIAYPFIITPVYHQGDYFGDGGEFLNYPITIFSNLDETIGITFVSHNENRNGTLKNRTPIISSFDYIKSLALTMSRATYTAQITESHLNRSIIINIVEKIDSMQFNLTADQKFSIYRAGVIAARQQIDGILGVPIYRELKFAVQIYQNSIPDMEHSFELLSD